jgi:hypothetical protein
MYVVDKIIKIKIYIEWNILLVTFMVISCGQKRVCKNSVLKILQ